MFECPSCNSELRETARICIKCGYRVTEDDRAKSFETSLDSNKKLKQKLDPEIQTYVSTSKIENKSISDKNKWDIKKIIFGVVALVICVVFSITVYIDKKEDPDVLTKSIDKSKQSNSGVNLSPEKNKFNSTENIQNQSLQFIGEYHRNISKNDEELMIYFDKLYSDNVDFYNTKTSKINILKQKSDFLKRWPIRDYKPRSTENQVECDKLKRFCLVRGVLDWNVRSIERNKESIGVAEFEFTLDFNGQYPLIIRENGKVLNRSSF